MMVTPVIVRSGSTAAVGGPLQFSSVAAAPSGDMGGRQAKVGAGRALRAGGRLVDKNATFPRSLQMKAASVGGLRRRRSIAPFAPSRIN